jgi:hypothetical protein
LPALAATGEHQLAEYIVFDEWQEFIEAFVLVVMRIDIGDQNIVERTLVRLFASVSQQPAGIQLLDGNAAAVIGK